MRRILLICFTISGASGLIYEVVWMRKLTLVFGSTRLAVSISLAAFLGGMALGAYVLGRLAHRFGSPSRAYGWMELAIAAYGLGSGTLLSLTGAAYAGLAEWGAATGAAAMFLQFTLVGAVLLVPTFLMGGTLPVLLAGYPGQRAGVRVGRLYAANMLGAAVGAAATGFWLLPALGLEHSLYTAAVLNACAGGLVMVWGRGAPAVRTEPVRKKASTRTTVAPGPLGVVSSLVFVAGFSTLFHEVVWTRALELVLGNSTRAFSAMLAVFLVGLAAGTAVSGAWVRRRGASLGALAGVQAALGMAIMATTVLLSVLPFWFLTLWSRWQESAAELLLSQFALASVVLIVPTFLMGLVFPMAVELVVTGQQRESAGVGRLYALNTLGNILGAGSAALVFIPLVGMQTCLLLGAWINLGLAGVLAGKASSSRRLAYVAAPALLVLSLSVAVPRWNMNAMTSGVYFYAPTIAAIGVDRFQSDLEQLKLVFHHEGPTGTVTVTETPSDRVLKIDGRGEGNLHGAAQVLVAHLPFMTDREIRDTFIVGFGTGTTTGMVTMYPVESIEVADLEPGVFEASHFFEAVNRRPRSDARVRARVADARQILFLSREASLDLILSQPSNPWVSGSSKLFTVDFYRLARSRLRPQGLFAQWLQLYNISPEGVRTLLKTFTSVFPEAFVFEVGSGTGEILLLGATQQLKLSWPALSATFSNEDRRAELSRVGFPHAGALLSSLVLGPRELERLTGSQPLNTDDNGLIEFSTLLTIYRPTTDENQEMLRSFAVDPLTYLDPAPPAFEQPSLYVQMARATGLAGDFPRSLKFAREAVSMGGGWEAHQTLGDVLHSQQPDEAVQAWHEALTLDPDNQELMLRLVVYYKDIPEDERPAEFARWVEHLESPSPLSEPQP